MRRFVLVGIVALAASGGCTGNQASSGLEPDQIAGPRDSGVPLTVQNETSRSLRVYVLTGGYETLLARVDPLSDRSMRLWNASAGTVSLVARAAENMDEQGHVSEPVEVMEGHRITWVLRASPGASGPRISYVRVFRCDTEDC